MTHRMRLARGLRSEIEALVPDIGDIVLYVNSSCNLRCKHCYVGDPLLSANNVFDTNDLCNFIEDFTSLSRMTVLGGEPLMHRGINQILRAALATGVSDLRLTTNLTGFFFWKAEQFEGAPMTVAVSLDGFSAQIHDQIRGAGTFDRTLANLRSLVAANFDVEISHTLTTLNTGSFDQLLALCKEVGVQKLNLHRMSLQGNAIENSSLHLSPSEWVDFCRLLESKALAETGQAGALRVRYPPIYTTREELERMTTSGEYWGHRERSYYVAGVGRRIVLYPNGRVYISSELFGTESHIGTIENGAFRPNDSATNEISAALLTEEAALIPQLNPVMRGDDQNPAVLSVSFKRLVFV